ncbi:MAG TPA: hypothetical protein VI320_06300 [Terracidiphilus sp.]|jgi:hypothetical protein
MSRSRHWKVKISARKQVEAERAVDDVAPEPYVGKLPRQSPPSDWDLHLS